MYVLEDGKWVKTGIKWDGKYMVFEYSGNCVTFFFGQGKDSPMESTGQQRSSDNRTSAFNHKFDYKKEKSRYSE